jgi:hypothetical protein
MVKEAYAVLSEPATRQVSRRGGSTSIVLEAQRQR